MGRKALNNWHVYCWNGTEFDLVWFDLERSEAHNLIAWRNRRAEDSSSPIRYVMCKDGDPPRLPAR